jgi:hypothetical protein
LHNTYEDYYVENNKNTNVFIATYTFIIVNARLRLYEILDVLGESIVYYDTDSIVYLDNGKNTAIKGCLLGDWTYKLGKGVCIIEWVSTGPKGYCNTTNTGKVVRKIKGFMYINLSSIKITNGD